MSAVLSMPVVRTAAGRGAAAVRCRDDLPGRVRLALRTARRAVAATSGAVPESPPSSGGARPPALVPAKVVGESAMLLRAMSFLRGEDAALDAEAQALAEALLVPARDARVMERLCNDPARALEHASAHLFLSDAGYRDAAFSRLLDGVLACGGVRGPERLPNHQLEGDWLDEIRGRRVHATRADETLLSRSCLGWPLDVLGCATLDLYLFTHVVMYASDMGRRDVWPPRPTADILADAEAALAAALDADNLDLAAELLWTWPMLRQAWSPLAAFAFGVVAQAQDEQGFLPGPDYARWAGAAGLGLAHEEVVLRTSYHADLVMGLLCAAALHPRSAPPTRPRWPRWPLAGEGGARRASAGLLSRLPARAVVPRWQRAFEALAPGHQDELAPLCFGVWFRRAAGRGDLLELRRALAATLEFSGGDGLSARQALGRLERAMAAGRMGAGVA